MAQSSTGSGALATLPAPGAVRDPVELGPEILAGRPVPTDARDGFSVLAEQVAAAETGEPVLLVGRRLQTEADGTPVGIGVEYALGSLAGRGSLEIDDQSGELVFPTTGFATLSRTGLRELGDWSSLRLQEGRLPSSRILGRISSDDIRQGLSLAAVLELRGTSAETGWLSSGQLTVIERSEARGMGAELAIGHSGVSRLIDRLTDSDRPAHRYFEQDFSLLRAISGQA